MKSLFVILFTAVVVTFSISGCAAKVFTSGGDMADISAGTDSGLEYMRRDPDGSITTVSIDRNQSKSVGKVIGGAVARAISGNVDTAITSGESIIKNRDAITGANEAARVTGQNTVNEITAQAAATAVP